MSALLLTFDGRNKNQLACCVVISIYPFYLCQFVCFVHVKLHHGRNILSKCHDLRNLISLNIFLMGVHQIHVLNTGIPTKAWLVAN